jgi:hypothetical protein
MPLRVPWSLCPGSPTRDAGTVLWLWRERAWRDGTGAALHAAAAIWDGAVVADVYATSP